MTAYATEYRYRKQNQEAEFMIQAECLNDDEMAIHIQELLDDYRAPYLPGASELTGAEFEAAEDKSVTAKQVLQSAFAIPEISNDRSYQSSGLDLESMKEASGDVYKKVLRRLRKLGRALPWPSGIEDGSWKAEVSTAKEVNQQLRPFIDRGLWVFVKIMR